jgi:hypothetical protein
VPLHVYFLQALNAACNNLKNDEVEFDGRP